MVYKITPFLSNDLISKIIRMQQTRGTTTDTEGKEFLRHFLISRQRLIRFFDNKFVFLHLLKFRLVAREALPSHAQLDLIQ